MNIELKPETILMFSSEPVILRKVQLNNIKNFLTGKVKDYQMKNLFSFTMYDLKEEMIYKKDHNIKASDFYISDYNSSLLLISNLRTCLKNKDFKYLRENLEIDFYSPQKIQ